MAIMYPDKTTSPSFLCSRGLPCDLILIKGKQVEVYGGFLGKFYFPAINTALFFFSFPFYTLWYVRVIISPEF